MFKKRVIILFFTLFLSNLYAENNLIEDSYKSSPKQYFYQGYVTDEDIKKDIAVYYEKNSFGFSNFSIQIDNEITKIANSDRSEKIKGNNTLFSIPLDILNYPLKNREITQIEKAKTYKFKNISCNKFLIKTAEPIIEEEPEVIITETDETTTSEEEPTDIAVEVKEPEPKKEYVKEKYDKVLYTIEDEANIILKKEFFINKTDREPAYTIEAININFIESYYIVTEWKIFSKNKSYTLKIDNKSIMYNKSDISNIFENLTSYSGM